MSNHTPGPWVVGPEVGLQVPVASIAMDGLKLNVAHVAGIRDGEGLANARLIAAAPDLLEALEKQHNWMVANGGMFAVPSLKAISALRQALETPKYRRGDRLLCLETEEYCVIHISGTDRQYVKFPDGHVGQYTNQQVAEHFELLPKEVDADDTSQERVDETAKQKHEPVGYFSVNDYGRWEENEGTYGEPLYTAPQKQWVGLREDEIFSILENLQTIYNRPPTEDSRIIFARAIEAKLKEKNT